jgi:hypothetical protein
MVFVNLFFVILNGTLMVYLYDEKKYLLAGLNLLAFSVNLVPVLNKLAL